MVADAKTSRYGSLGIAVGEVKRRVVRAVRFV